MSNPKTKKTRKTIRRRHAYPQPCPQVIALRDNFHTALADHIFKCKRCYRDIVRELARGLHHGIL